MRKPVILAGEAHYGNKGFTYDSTTQEQYLELLRGAGNISRLSDEQFELAKVYAHCYFIRRQIPMDVVQDKNSKWWNLQPNKLGSIAPGNDPFIDFICDRIVDGQDFIMDDHLTEISERLDF